jgi:HEAT repeats
MHLMTKDVRHTRLCCGVIVFMALLLSVSSMGQCLPVYAQASDLHIAVDQDQLTMRVQDAPLVEVVEQLTQLLFLTSHVDPGLDNMLVTLSVNDMPFRQGIAQLLANTNYVLTDRDLYVWARGESSKQGGWRERKPEALPSEPEKRPAISEEELRYQAIYGEDPEARAEALEMLSHEGEEKALPTIVQALKDQSPEVRGRALELLGESEGPIPVDQIAKIVTDDPHPEQRMEAMVLLASREEEVAKAILQNALNDSDPEVVELAKSILQDIEPDSELDELR